MAGKKRSPGSSDAAQGLGQRVLWILETSGKSGREFARKASISPALIGQITRAENATTGADKVEAIAKAAGVSLEWLMTGKGEPRPGEPGPAEAPTEEPVPTPRRAEDGRWRLYAATRPFFASAASEALEAGASERVLDSAADRLRALAPTYAEAADAIAAAASGVAEFRRRLGMTDSAVPGSLHRKDAHAMGPGGKGKATSRR